MADHPQFAFAYGDAVDARDSVNRWYESRVLDRRFTAEREAEYFVHFRGWQPRFDTWVSGDAIAPLHTVTQNWRPRLRVGDTLEFSERPGRWLHATVTDVSRNAPNTETTCVAVRKESSRGSQEPSIWVDVDCEKLCQHHTHLRNSPAPAPAPEPPEPRQRENVSSELGVSLWSIRKEGLLTDVEMEVGGQVFPVHRCVLAAASGVFRAMFTAQTKDKDAARLTLPDLSPQTFLDMIKFMYTSCIDASLDGEERLEAGAAAPGPPSEGAVDDEDAKEDAEPEAEPPGDETMEVVDAEAPAAAGEAVQPPEDTAKTEPYATGRLVRLVLASDRFDIGALTRACEEQLSRSLHHRNNLRLLALARHLRLATLENAAREFFVDNASDIVLSKSLWGLLTGERTFEVAWEDGWDDAVEDVSTAIEDEMKC